ncbi:MAG: hypothetical protein WBW81_12175 [Methylocella sp.]
MGMACGVEKHMRFRQDPKINAILGICTNGSLETVLPFLVSSEIYVKSARVFLFVDNVGEEFYRYCEKHDVKTIPIRSKRDLHILSERYFFFRDYLISGALDSYDKILLTDVRDVFFQSDCFKMSWPTPQIFAAEDGLIRDEMHNRKWILDVYGPLVLEALGDCRIVCAGTTFASRKLIISYVEAMCNEIERMSQYHKEFGPDQAAHNYLLRTGVLDPGCIDYAENVVATLGICRADRISVDKNGMVLKNERAAAVIHQWDRHPELNFIVRRFREEGFRSKTVGEFLCTTAKALAFLGKNSPAMKKLADRLFRLGSEIYKSR